MKFSQYEEVAKKYGVGGGGDWFNLKEGENRVRLLNEFEVYGEHWMPAEKKFIVCIGKEEGCKPCKNKVSITVRALGWVIDRADGKVKLFKMPYTVFKALGALQSDADYGFDLLPEYDLKINRIGTGKESEYTVLPTPKITPLTEAEITEMDKKMKPAGEIIEKMKNKVKEQPPAEEYAVYDDAPVPEDYEYQE